MEHKSIITGFIITIKDVTYFESIAAELSSFHTTTKEIETIFKYASEGLCIINNYKVILRCNDALSQIMCAKPWEIEKRHVKELEFDGIIDKSIGEAVLSQNAEVTITQRSSKSHHNWITTGKPIFDKEGKILFVVSTARDIYKLNEMYRSSSNQFTMNYKNTFFTKEQEKIIDKVGIKGVNKRLHEIINNVFKIAKKPVTVLIRGESGTGKELIAKLIHESSDRKFTGKLVSVNCGALPRELLEAELFGYVGGSFTGAKKEGKKGLFELADKGTIFLDEIGDLPFDLQVKLLRAVEYGELSKVGSVETISFDARIVAATNKDLQKMVNDGLFREDLFYRLNVVPICLPPLREVPEDIVAIVKHFADLFNKKYQINKEFSQATLEILQKYNWPGNIRELRNLVERLIITTDSDIINQTDLPTELIENAQLYKEIHFPLRESLENFERRIILDTYRRYGSTYKVAEVLEISQTSAVRKVNKYKCSSM